MEQDRLKRAWLIGELGLVLIFILLFILALKDVIKLQNNHTVDVYLHLKLHYMITFAHICQNRASLVEMSP